MQILCEQLYKYIVAHTISTYKQVNFLMVAISNPKPYLLMIMLCFFGYTRQLFSKCPLMLRICFHCRCMNLPGRFICVVANHKAWITSERSSVGENGRRWPSSLLCGVHLEGRRLCASLVPLTNTGEWMRPGRWFGRQLRMIFIDK